MTDNESRRTLPVDTAALGSLLAAATPGPWKTLGHDGVWRVEGTAGETVFDDGSADGEYDQKCTTADRDAILALRDAAPALLDEIERLRTDLAATRATLDCANALIGEAADDAKRLSDDVERLRAELAATHATVACANAIIDRLRWALLDARKSIREMAGGDPWSGDGDSPEQCISEALAATVKKP
jgi:uncharacterized small protein (DUF1192 family)